MLWLYEISCAHQGIDPYRTIDWRFFPATTPQNTYSSDLQDFIAQNPACLEKIQSLAPGFLDVLSNANIVDARSNPSLQQQTLGQLGGTSLRAELQQMTLGAVFSSGGAAVTIWDTQTVYIGNQYYEEIVGQTSSGQDIWGRSNSVTRGQTIFHEGLHLYFKTDHVGLMSSLQTLGIPNPQGSVAQINPDAGAALNIHAWLKGGWR